MPVLSGLDADHLWLMEYDVDFAGRWDDLFAPFADRDADLLTTTLMYRAPAAEVAGWRTAASPLEVPGGAGCAPSTR